MQRDWSFSSVCHMMSSLFKDKSTTRSCFLVMLEASLASWSSSSMQWWVSLPTRTQRITLHLSFTSVHRAQTAFRAIKEWRTAIEKRKKTLTPSNSLPSWSTYSTIYLDAAFVRAACVDGVKTTTSQKLIADSTMKWTSSSWSRNSGTSMQHWTSCCPIKRSEIYSQWIWSLTSTLNKAHILTFYLPGSKQPAQQRPTSQAPKSQRRYRKWHPSNFVIIIQDELFVSHNLIFFLRYFRYMLRSVEKSQCAAILFSNHSQIPGSLAREQVP